MNSAHELLLKAGLEETVFSIQKRAEFLEKAQMGKGLDWAELQTLASFFEVFQATPGTVICHQRDDSNFMCIVCLGRVDVVKDDLGQHHKVIATIGPGNSLGEMSLIDGEGRSASVLAKTPVTLLVMSRESFERLSEAYPRLWGKLVAKVAISLSKRLRLTSGVLAEYLES